MKISNDKITFSGDKGANLEVDLKSLDISDNHKDLLKRVINGDQINEEERNKLKELKALVNFKTPHGLNEAMIVRFDASWVRID